MLKFQRLRFVERRFLEILGGHGVRKFENQVNFLAVAVVEVPVLHVAVELKVLRPLGGKVEDARARHAV